MASIKKRAAGGAKPWRARWIDPATGKECAKHFARRVDAVDHLDGIRGDIARGTYVSPAAGKTTVAAYAATWLARMAPTWRASTAAAVRNSLERHVLPTLGARSLASLRKGDVEALCASLALAPSTVATVHQHLAQLLSGAVDDELIPRNPAARARLPKREASRAQPVPLEVVERITAELPDWLAAAVPLGLGCGLRQGEASGLTVDRTDFLRRTLRVDRQLLSRQVPAPTLGPPKTPSSHRTIPLAGFVVDALADHLRRFPAEPGDLVLRTPTGAPVDANAFGHQWRRACRRAGVPGLGFHALRHTFASTLLSRGVSVKAVADWLGHASPAITLSTYAHLMPADEEVARTVLHSAFAESLANEAPATLATALGSQA